MEELQGLLVTSSMVITCGFVIESRPALFLIRLHIAS